jgi:hypothetical protein
VESEVNSPPVDEEVFCVETLPSVQSGRGGERVMERVELGKGGVREKIRLRFRRLKEGVTQGEAERGDGDCFQNEMGRVWSTKTRRSINDTLLCSQSDIRSPPHFPVTVVNLSSDRFNLN